ncbi:LysR family transcriptional regulator [Vibrio sp. B1Z05]|uniref:LysR family transcriptional regulator n=1 Tax=Vibrio sp. B1Z05 TaxID=2654980 RepID=UPI00128CCC5C|nr:LysR family transcriptional regulator [Vibrio sp. B1Z05]MPW36145.1 LysR family transcriptional regulator [Vibrio sp. B1Z05]
MAKHFDNFYIFCQVVKLGSMKAASEELEIPLSTVSRRISTLEEDVNTRLFIRSKTTLSPTSTGTQYYQRLAPHFLNLAEEIDNINNDKNDISGRVSIDCTDFVYQYFIKDKVEELLRKYPKLKLKFIPASDTSTLDSDADIGVLVGDLPDSNLIAKKLMSIDVKVVASPTFMQTPPTKLAQLKELDYIGHLQHQLITGYNTKTSHLETVKLYPKISLTSAQSVVQMAKNNFGFALVSEYIAENAIKNGELIEWMTDYEFPSRDISLVYRYRARKTNAQQVVIDAIVAGFNEYKENPTKQNDIEHP